MLINLTNHHSSKWAPEQLKASMDLYGDVTDIPFPIINPMATTEMVVELARDHLLMCQQLFSSNVANGKRAVHLMGEMTFTYILVNLLRDAEIEAIASTTERSVVVGAGGEKTSVFRFVRFRPYFSLINPA